MLSNISKRKILSLLFVFSSYSYAVTPQQYAREVAQEAMKQVPLKITGDITAQGVFSYDSTILYIKMFHNINKEYLARTLDHTPESLGVWYRNEYEAGMRNFLCSAPESKSAINFGVAWEYIFMLNDGTYVTKIRIDSCS